MLRIARFFLQKLSRGRVMELVCALSEFHRIRGSPGYDSALDFLKAQLDSAGVENEVFTFPLDGETDYWTWRMPPAWNARKGKLTLIAKNPITICDYSENPISLVPGSSSLEGRFPLVSVGAGTKDEDYYGKDVRGKAVLATGHPSVVYPLAIEKYEAACVLFDHMPKEDKSIGRVKLLMQDIYSYAGMFPNFTGAGAAFAITHRSARDIRRKLSRNPLEVHVSVDAENFKGTGRVLISRIRGKEPDGIVIVAHLCHPRPGANDNASGSALAAEIAITLQRLISSGDLPQPSKSITFIWVPEMFGTVALAHEKPEMVRRFLAGIDLDMVGEDQEKTKGQLIIEPSPWSLPCFMGYLIEGIIKEVKTSKIFRLPEYWSFKRQDFSGGSDHYILSDPTIGVPTVMIGHWPDLFYHSSADTPDKVSSEEMILVGSVVSVALWLGCWEHDMTRKVIKTLIDGTEEDLSRETEAAPERLALLWAQRREGALSFAVTREEPYRIVADTDEGYRELANKLGIEDIFFSIGGPVFRRNFKAPLYMRTFFSGKPDRHRGFIERMMRDPDYPRILTEAVFLINGRRSFREIMEFLKVEYPSAEEEDIREFLLELREAGLIEQVEHVPSVLRPY